MKNTLCEFLNVVYPFLDEVLANNDSLKGIDAVASSLPCIPVVSEAGFECHLTNKVSNADILVAFSNKKLTEGCLSDLSSLSSTSEPWQRINKLIGGWSADRLSVYKDIENIWLEFDICKESFGGQVPSLFFAPGSLGGFVERYNESESHTLFDEVLKQLVGRDLSLDTKKRIAQCCNYLPEGGRVFQVGVMLPRASESGAIRLCINGLEIRSVNSYLVSIGWHDKTGELKKLLDDLSVFVDRVALNIAVGDVVHDKIGIECYICKQPRFVPHQWNLLFEFLQERNLCTHEQTFALLKWPGYTQAKECMTEWPQNILQATSIAPSFKSIAARAINHVKFVYQPKMPLQAKAYLWFGHCWMDMDGKLQAG